MKEKNIMNAHRRLLNEAKGKIISAAKDISAVGITNGISAICSAVGRDGDVHDWEADLSSTLVRALKRMDEARDEINNAIEIVTENGGADEENEKDK